MGTGLQRTGASGWTPDVGYAEDETRGIAGVMHASRPLSWCLSTNRTMPTIERTARTWLRCTVAVEIRAPLPGQIVDRTADTGRKSGFPSGDRNRGRCNDDSFVEFNPSYFSFD